jgi:hypothetical protein
VSAVIRSVERHSFVTDAKLSHGPASFTVYDVIHSFRRHP